MARRRRLPRPSKEALEALWALALLKNRVVIHLVPVRCRSCQLCGRPCREFSKDPVTSRTSLRDGSDALFVDEVRCDGVLGGEELVP